MRDVDDRFAALASLGTTVGIVADHGMADMALPDGRPNVLYLGDRLDAAFGEGATRVICPITDPFVRHHGALGGFVRLYLLRPELDREAVLGFVRSLPGVGLALVREEAAERFELPYDREGDIAVVGERGCAIGSRAVEHDLSQLAGVRLRSHGSLAEQRVPFLLSQPLIPAYAARSRTTRDGPAPEGRRGEEGASPAAAASLRNFDIFEYVLNGTY
jgi:phosphonoacetate hydrolase